MDEVSSTVHLNIFEALVALVAQPEYVWDIETNAEERAVGNDSSCTGVPVQWGLNIVEHQLGLYLSEVFLYELVILDRG